MGLKREPINLDARVMRAQEAAHFIFMNLAEALLIEQLLEIPNRWLSAGLKLRAGLSKQGYKATRVAYASHLTLLIAKMYDSSGYRSKLDQDKASLPIFFDLVEERDVREAICSATPRNPLPGKADAQHYSFTVRLNRIERATCIYQSVTQEYANQLKDIRELRNNRLAHSLLNKAGNPTPTWAAILSVLRATAPICEEIVAAAFCRSLPMEYQVQGSAHEARAFWSPMFERLA